MGSPSQLRICIIYDCLFPYTVGGAERWYRNLSERLAAEGHHVTYLTLRQWEKDERGEMAGVDVIAVGPRCSLYNAAGARRIRYAGTPESALRVALLGPALGAVGLGCAE